MTNKKKKIVSEGIFIIITHFASINTPVHTGRLQCGKIMSFVIFGHCFSTLRKKMANFLNFA